MRIYLTSSWSNRDRMRWLEGWLVKQGHRVLSTWYIRDYPEDAPPSWWSAIDLAEIDCCDAVVLYTDDIDESCHGAMDFEAGYGWRAGKKLYYIGKDARNIFVARYGVPWEPTAPPMPRRAQPEPEANDGA